MKNLRSFIKNSSSIWTLCSKHAFCTTTIPEEHSDLSVFRSKLRTGPRLQDFISNADRSVDNRNALNLQHPYLQPEDIAGKQQKVLMKTYGCQMNVNDTEIAWSVLKNAGFLETKDVKEADVVLLMTCAIRESAEQTVWNMIDHLKHLKQKRDKHKNFKIGLLGCMAERLKERVIEKEKLVDIVAGPDSYRDLPQLLAIANSGETAVNVQLSLDETYADIVPVRVNPESTSAFISIMRGCDNMCTFCIVPFTRGRERSRPVTSILDEVKMLSDQGVKEVTLLGQNVNSYRDKTEESHTFIKLSKQKTSTSRGFGTVYVPKEGGLQFADLLNEVSLVDPEMRIRFTSPHPKDFPDEVLQVIKERPNICNQLHLPAQSGNTEVLRSMRRGYGRDEYLDLVSHIRETLPDVALTSDIICGFCGETEEAHRDTLSLLEKVRYSFVWCYPYSMREYTYAFRRLHDNVPREVKLKRVDDVTERFRGMLLEMNKMAIGSNQLVLVEGHSKRSELDLRGRNESGIRVIFPNVSIPDAADSHVQHKLQIGDYVVVQITGCTSQVLKGNALHFTSLQEFFKKNNPSLYL